MKDVISKRPPPQGNLNPREIAAILGLKDPRTVHGYLNSGKLTGHRLPVSGYWRVHPNDLAAFQAGFGAKEQPRVLPNVPKMEEFDALIDAALKDAA